MKRWSNILNVRNNHASVTFTVRRYANMLSSCVCLYVCPSHDDLVS